jgi:DNA-binding CsgD family transcriptional regulator
MNNKERWFIILIFLGISFLTFFDIVTDLREGVTWWHVSVEGMIGLIAASGVVYLIRGTFKLKHNLEDKVRLSMELQEQNIAWKQKSKKFLEGLSQTIDDQLSNWELTKSEKEVAFLLLKGLSLKEVAEVRSTTEKTARTQSAAIYAKANLSNRSQLSAFFLEDLLLPQ